MIEIITMKQLEIDNLSKIIKLEYPHICLHPFDLMTFTNIPVYNKGYYPITYRRGTIYGKKGWFNNGRTTCWSEYTVKPGHIKIANTMPTDSSTGWYPEMSFQEPDSVDKIIRLLRLKAFW